MAGDTHDHTLGEALCRHLAGALATLVGGSPLDEGGHAPAGGWHVRLAVSGGGAGKVWIGVSTADAALIAKRVIGIDDEPAQGAIRDTLKELVAQAVGAIATEPAAAGLDIQIDDVQPSLDGAPAEDPAVWTSGIGDGLHLTIATWSAVKQSAQGAKRAAQAAQAAQNPRAAVQPAGTGFSAVQGFSALGQGAGGENLDLILDIDLPMSVRFGKTELALGALTRLGPGSIIDLGRSPDEPVEVLVSGRVVARGDVVVVGGNYGVRITDVVNSMGSRQ